MKPWRDNICRGWISECAVLVCHLPVYSSTISLLFMQFSTIAVFWLVIHILTGVEPQWFDPCVNPNCPPLSPAPQKIVSKNYKLKQSLYFLESLLWNNLCVNGPASLIGENVTTKSFERTSLLRMLICFKSINRMIRRSENSSALISTDHRGCSVCICVFVCVCVCIYIYIYIHLFFS
jgi:hypothetical protein